MSTVNQPFSNGPLQEKLIRKGNFSEVSPGAAHTHMFGNTGTYNGRDVSTEMLQEFIISTNGNPAYLDIFHSFQYGTVQFPHPSKTKNNIDGEAGSSELWFRNSDDGIEANQEPKEGQENWIYARIANETGSGKAKHIVVIFYIQQTDKQEFTYPDDFLSVAILRSQIYLYPGNTGIVKVCMPQSYFCSGQFPTVLFASVISREKCSSQEAQHWVQNKIISREFRSK